MSEEERKKRSEYKRKRTLWKRVQLCVIVIVTLAALCLSMVYYRLNKEYYISYSENGSVDYKVYLKENEFYDSVHQESNQSYVASLIDRVIANFSYEIDMDTDDVNYKYSYIKPPILIN